MSIFLHSCLSSSPPLPLVCISFFSKYNWALLLWINHISYRGIPYLCQFSLGIDLCALLFRLSFVYWWVMPLEKVSVYLLSPSSYSLTNTKGAWINHNLMCVYICTHIYTATHQQNSTFLPWLILPFPVLHEDLLQPFRNFLSWHFLMAILSFNSLITMEF